MRNNRRLETTRPAHNRGSQATSSVRRRNQDNYKCALCKTFHALRFCRKFLKMSTKKREEVVERYRYCTNCLARSHDLRACSSMDTCRICDRYHHTLLHPRRRRSLEANGPRHRHHQNRRRIQPTNQQPTKEQPTTQQTTNQQAKTQANPDTKVIVEAIRSLAQVLCAQGDSSIIA